MKQKLACLSMLLLILCVGAVAAQSPEDAPYRDASLPIEARVEDLLGRLSLAEKIGQMTLVESGSISPQQAVEYHVGAILTGGDGGPTDNTAENWYAFTQAYQDAALEAELGIPILYGIDAIHGHNNVRGSVIFPHNIGLGAAANPALMHAIGRVTACQMLATGIHWNYAPVLAVPQDIRWGRFYESYGQDPDLVQAQAQAFVEGLQGSSLSATDTVMATLKHFVADGGTVWREPANPNYMREFWGYPIDQGDAPLDEAELRAVHLAPYVGLHEETWSIMASFSSWKGTKVHASAYLMTHVLKDEMGFAGFVVSDWAAIDQITPDYYQAVVTSINAGVDMNMVPYDYRRFIDVMQRAVDAGDIELARIDDAVRRILRAKFALGLFEDAAGRPDLLAQYDAPAYRALSRSAVSQSVVLLQNENEALPLSPDIRTLFIAGEAADDIGIQSGGWTINWQGSTGATTPGTTIREALESGFGEDVRVVYNRFGRFDRFVDDTGNPLMADAAVVVIGEAPYAEGAGDRPDLSLTEADLLLIERASAQAETLIVVMLTGRPLIISDHLDLADAWVAAWLPGTEGAGIADVLTGAHPFVGRLALTWPRDMAQVPLGASDAAPLFEPGWGIRTGEAPAVTPVSCD